MLSLDQYETDACTRKNNKATEAEIEEHERQIKKFMNEKAEPFLGQFTLIDVDRLSYILENLTI